METLTIALLAFCLGGWLSRRKAVAQAFAKGVAQATATAQATGGSVVLAIGNDGQVFRTLLPGAVQFDEAVDDSSDDHRAIGAGGLVGLPGAGRDFGAAGSVPSGADRWAPPVRREARG